MKTINLALIEDDIEFAHYLQKKLNQNEGFLCSRIFLTAEEAIRSLPKENFDVVLTDIGLPNASGIECIIKLKPLCSDTEFLVLTSMDDPVTVFEALKAGATGYLVKTDSTEQILSAITQINEGGSPMSTQIARLVVSHFSETKSPDLEKLSRREQEILELLSNGFRYKEIGDQIFISVATVRTHVRNIYRKLQVGSRTEALNKIYNRRI